MQKIMKIQTDGSNLTVLSDKVTSIGGELSGVFGDWVYFNSSTMERFSIENGE